MGKEISQKRILLVGGAGFIGHNLALRLKELGAEVIIIDSLQVNNLLAFTSSETEVPNRDLYLAVLNQRIDLLRRAGVTMFVQDSRDYHALSKLIEKIAPEVVIHLAAVAHASKSNKDPYGTFDHSLRTLENALDCSKNRVDHFIYFSSSMVYGHFQSGVVTEETVCEPIGIYGALKYSGEKLVIAYNQTFDLPYTIIRPSALYGERCVSRRVGQVFIENALQGKVITIAGSGSERLDFTYIADLLNGVIKVIENKQSRNQIFNLTYGVSRSLNDLFQIVKHHFPDIHLDYIPKDKLTPDRGTLSTEKAKLLIGYDPEWPLEKGFSNYINWYKEFTRELDMNGVFHFIQGD